MSYTIESLGAKVEHMEGDIKNLKKLEPLATKIECIEDDIRDLKKEVKDFTEVKVQLKTLSNTVENLAGTVRENNSQVNENIKQLAKTVEMQMATSREYKDESEGFKDEIYQKINELENKEAQESLQQKRKLQEKIFDYVFKGIVALLILGGVAWLSSNVQKINSNAEQTTPCRQECVQK